MCNRYVSPDQAAIERYWQTLPSNPLQWPKAGVFPRQPGPFVRRAGGGRRELVVGQWGLVPFFAKSRELKFSTNNARIEGVTSTASFKQPWAKGQRCIIPATVFLEPCWESGRNVWWAFRRADGEPWGLAGLWNAWVDRESGEVVESYTMLTQNADDHPLMRRMHKPDPKLPPDGQDKRSVVAIERGDVAQWLEGTVEEAQALVQLTPAEAMLGKPEG